MRQIYNKTEPYNKPDNTLNNVDPNEVMELRQTIGEIRRRMAETRRRAVEAQKQTADYDPILDPVKRRIAWDALHESPPTIPQPPPGPEKPEPAKDNEFTL